MLMSDLPANSHIENARIKENKRHKKRLVLVSTLAELISEFAGIEEKLCESLKQLAPSKEKTVAEFTATVKIFFQSIFSLKLPWPFPKARSSRNYPD